MNFNGSGSYVNGNKNSFLFAILDNKAIKCKCVDGYFEIFTERSCFLSFGSRSLVIAPDCNINSSSYGIELGSHFEQSTLPTKYLAG